MQDKILCCIFNHNAKVQKISETAKFFRNFFQFIFDCIYIISQMFTMFRKTFTLGITRRVI